MGVCPPRGWLHSAFSQPCVKQVLSPPSQAVPTRMTHSLPLSSPRREEILNEGHSRGIWTHPGSVLFHRQRPGEVSGFQLMKESSPRECPRCLRAPAAGTSSVSSTGDRGLGLPCPVLSPRTCRQPESPQSGRLSQPALLGVPWPRAPRPAHTFRGALSAAWRGDGIPGCQDSIRIPNHQWSFLTSPYNDFALSHLKE